MKAVAIRLMATVWAKLVVALLVLGLVGWAAFGIARQSQQRRRDAAESRRYICEQVNQRALAPLHGLLEQAQTTASRNPLPPGLSDEARAYYEAQRAVADEFYRQWVAETQPVDCSRLP